jgi:hypothetical protein
MNETKERDKSHSLAGWITRFISALLITTLIVPGGVDC